MTRVISGLSELVDRYDALLCDVWGVIHNGRESFPAAIEALRRWRTERGPVILISNAPRPAEAVLSQLTSLQVPRDAWDAFVTSGDATRSLLAARAPGPAWMIGPPRDGPLFEGLGLEAGDEHTSSFIAVSGLFDDETETPEDYRARFETAAARKLTMICANPDRVVQRGDHLIYCGGALADVYEAMGGEVLMAGKPYAPVYDLCLAQAAQLKPGLKRERVLCIGDGVITDVMGAANQRLDCLFIASGIHGGEAVSGGRVDENAVEQLLATEGTTAPFAMADLTW